MELCVYLQMYYTRGRAKVKLFDVHVLCRFDVSMPIML